MTRARLFLLMAMWLATAACWSSDRAFITLTETPIPTIAPTIQAVEGKYKVGENVTVAGSGLATVYLTANPEAPTRRNRVAGGVCSAGSTIPIATVAEVDGVTYYQVTCNSVSGWVAEDSLSPLDS
jgi:hypothetical protein